MSHKGVLIFLLALSLHTVSCTPPKLVDTSPIRSLKRARTVACGYSNSWAVIQTGDVNHVTLLADGEGPLKFEVGDFTVDACHIQSDRLILFSQADGFHDFSFDLLKSGKVEPFENKRLNNINREGQFLASENVSGNTYLLFSDGTCISITQTWASPTRSLKFTSSQVEDAGFIMTEIQDTSAYEISIWYLSKGEVKVEKLPFP